MALTGAPSCRSSSRVAVRLALQHLLESMSRAAAKFAVGFAEGVGVGVGSLDVGDGILMSKSRPAQSDSDSESACIFAASSDRSPWASNSSSVRKISAISSQDFVRELGGYQLPGYTDIFNW